MLNIGSAVVGFAYYFCIFNDVTFLIATLFETVLMAGSMGSMAPHIMKVFGMKYFIEIGGIINFGVGITNTLSSVFAFFINVYLNNSDLSYAIMFIVSGGLACIAVFLGLFENEEEFKY